MDHERAVHNMAVESYLLGEMAADERDAFETHYFECAVCADDLRAASQFMTDAKDILAAERAQAQAKVAPSRRTTWNWLGWLQPQFAAAVIAMLVVIVGVGALRTIPGLERRLDEASAPKIVSTTVLREQTRGAPIPLKTLSGEPAVLRFDLLEAVTSDVKFLIKASDGRTVLQWPGRTAGEETLTLSIPRLDLPAGIYTLVVETSPANGQSGRELGQYRFEVKSAL